jgi:hypothetical protein
MDTLEEKITIMLSLPADFSRLLDRMLIDLKDQGVRMTKRDLVIRLCRLGYLQETKQSKN